jgi:phycocyanobilin lyase alpha subunit
MTETPITWTPETAIANLRSPDLSQRYYAAWWLGKMRVREAIEPLLVALTDEEDRTELGGYPLRRNAARALGKLGDVTALPHLQQALNCEDFYVREACAQAIGEIAQASGHNLRPAQATIPALLHFLNSPDNQPYEAILETLGQLQAVSAQPVIEAFLDHSLPRIRMAAARALYSITHNPHYAELLVAQLHNPDVNLRRSALNDLGHIGYLPAVKAIAECAVENSFKLLALKNILGHHLPADGMICEVDTELCQTLQEIMLHMDDLL